MREEDEKPCQHVRWTVKEAPDGMCACSDCGATRIFPLISHAPTAEDWETTREVREEGLAGREDAAPAFVVRNAQRFALDGDGYPGCVGCGNVYAHAEGCRFLVTS